MLHRVSYRGWGRTGISTPQNLKNDDVKITMVLVPIYKYKVAVVLNTCWVVRYM